MHKTLVCVAIVMLLTTVTSYASEQRHTVVIYDGVSSEVATSPGNAKGLWVMLKDLTRATTFVVKPQGVCRDELCFPIPKGRKADFLNKRDGVEWFNLSEFAKLVKQPSAHDDKNGVWYFGKREDERGTYLASLEAPNFTLPDMAGRTHSLSDFRGKKVLLITWASW